jgi:hypothetical protein
MIDAESIKRKILGRHEDWTVNVQNSGKVCWVNIITPSRKVFIIEMHPDLGIGVSERLPRQADVDFSGHDEAFDNLEEAIAYIENNVRKGTY